MVDPDGVGVVTGRNYRLTVNTWEIVGGIEIDSACCAFADPGALGAGFTLRDQTDGPAQDGPVDGLPLVVCGTGMDLAVPLEMRWDARDEVVAARLCFVTDVDELDEAGDGSWEHLSPLDLASGRCVACDPYCFSSADCYRFVFLARPGRWSVERFRSDGAVLGLRVIRDHERGPVA